MTFLEWYTRNVPAELSLPVQQRVDALASLPNYPKSWVQGSPRMVPGVLPWALSSKPAALQGLQLFVEQEAEWRGFPGTVPAPLAFHPDGTPWLNEQGVPVPVDQWESGHLTADQLLVAANLEALPKAARKAAWQQALWLRDSVVATIPGTVGLLPWLSGNPRGPGWGLRFLVRQYRALPLQSLLARMGELLEGLQQLAKAQGAPGSWWPFYNPAAKKQADHGNLDLCSWMILGPLLSGFCEVRALGLELGVPTDIVDELIGRCLTFAEHAFFAGEQKTLLPGRLADDLDHADPAKVHISTPGTYGAMPPWALMGLADADQQGLLGTDLRTDTLELYNGCPFFDTDKPGFGADSKLLGLTIRCGGQWGFHT